MAITSGLFNSINGDRRYDAKWFAQYFATFIGNGVFPNPSTGLQVIANSNMTTSVKMGKGWINGYFIVNDGDYVLRHDNADGVLKRIDRVVMKLNHVKREIEVLIKKGGFASSPVAPSLQRDADAYELALADVLITNGATQITQANITDQRLNTSLCGIVHGTVNQVDTTTIFNQYMAWLDETKSGVSEDMLRWKEQYTKDFEEWFESIKDIYEGDVVANLAARLTLLENEHKGHVDDRLAHNIYGVATGVNTLTLNLTPPITEYKEGLTIRFKNTSANTSTGASLNVNGLGAKAIRKNGDIGAPAPGALKAGAVYTVMYVGNSFFLLDEGGEYGTAVVGDVRKGKTIGTQDGIKTGTLDLANLIPGNIRSGIVIDGVTGNLGTINAGENQILPWEYSYVPRSDGSRLTSWTLSRYGTQIEKSGRYRVRWSMSKLGSPSGGVYLTVYCKLYKNNVEIPGTLNQITSDTTTNTMQYWMDMDLIAGDVLRIGALTPDDSRPYVYTMIDGLYTDFKVTNIVVG